MADGHRLYDPHDPQDRMMLGVHGAFNEFELSLIIERMQDSLRQKASRGEQYDALPPGYICRHPPLCEKHPDPRVQRLSRKCCKTSTDSPAPASCTCTCSTNSSNCRW